MLLVLGAAIHARFFAGFEIKEEICCIEKCPQHIEIPDFLEKVTEELEGPDLKQREEMVKKMFNVG